MHAQSLGCFCCNGRLSERIFGVVVCPRRVTGVFQRPASLGIGGMLCPYRRTSESGVFLLLGLQGCAKNGVGAHWVDSELTIGLRLRC